MDKETLHKVFKASMRAGRLVNDTGMKLTRDNLEQMVKWTNDQIRSRDTLFRFKVMDTNSYELEVADLRKLENEFMEVRDDI